MAEFYTKKVVIPMDGETIQGAEFCDYYPREKNLWFYELGAKYLNSSISIRVYPQIGFKSTGLMYNGFPIELVGEEWDATIHYSAPWGSYLGYPTPNRVRNGRFIFQGQTVDMKKYGKKREMHGLAYDSIWEYAEPEIYGDGVKIKGWIEMRPGDINYSAFPYRNRLTCEYRLENQSMTFSYKVENLDRRPMPFGFCRHPFFMIPDPNEQIEIKVDAEDVYETSKDLLPTGNFLPVSNDPALYLREFRDLRELRLDTVFTHLHSDAVYIRYPQRGFQMRIKASEEFKNVVVFTLTSMGYLPDYGLPGIFCIENQTCCTDAINMHEKGFLESGLLILEPGQSKMGEICYRFEDI